MMKKGAPVAADPDAYVRALRGWKKDVGDGVARGRDGGGERSKKSSSGGTSSISAMGLCC